VVGTLHGIAGSEGRVRRVASWTCWPAAVSPCRTDDRCAFFPLGDTVARFTVMRERVPSAHSYAAASFSIRDQQGGGKRYVAQH
jgi:hypothetical protein